MKKSNKLKGLLLSIVTVLSLSIGLTPENVEASEGNEGSVTVSVEKFTLGQGYIIEPVEVPINEGDTADVVVTEVLGEDRYTTGPSSSFYLASVYDPESAGEVDTIPQYILDIAGGTVSPNKDEWLGEFDFTFMSGWTYFANNVFAPIGMGSYDLNDGDVIRVQFTVSFGDVIGQAANRDALTKKIGEINSSANKAEVLSKPGVQEAYDQAYAALTNLESTQEQVDEAAANLTNAIEADIEAPVIEINDIETEQTVEYDTNFTVPVLNAVDNVDESVEVTSTITDSNGNRLETLDTNTPGTYTITYTAQDSAGNTAEPVVLTIVVEDKVATALDPTEQVNATMAYLLETVTNPSFGTAAGEWTILSLARSGYDVPESYYDTYYDNIVNAVNELMPASARVPEGRLDRNKGSEHSRLIIALTAIGKDVTDVGYDPLTSEGYNILAALADYNFMIGQGINGPIYALIALDSGNYEIPQVEDVPVQATREMYINYILERAKDGGGWSLFGDADVDITAMAIQGLTPYYTSNSEVKSAVDEALAWLSSVQGPNGGFQDPWGGYSSESVAQVVVALTGLEIDVDTDARFIKNGNSIIDSLMSFAVPSGGFKHFENDDYINGMSTDQAAYALVAYQRYVNGENRLYDMSDVFKEPEQPITDDENLAELEAQIAELLNKLEKLENQYASLIEENSSLQAQIDSLNKQITALQNESENSAIEIAALEERLAELEQAVINLESEVGEEDATDDNQEPAIGGQTDDENATNTQSTDRETVGTAETEEGLETEENTEELPSTGTTDYAVWTMVGILFVGTGLIFIRKKQTN
jgi:LPXTG-motif cell wall-anchored protein